MSRKRKQEAKVEMPKAIEEIKPRRFTPRPCTACTALRPNGASYSEVYHTRGNLRYCKCKFCGNTWSQFLELSTTPVVQSEANVMKESESMPSLVHGINSIVTVTD
jgi:hypothetical protein